MKAKLVPAIVAGFCMWMGSPAAAEEVKPAPEAAMPPKPAETVKPAEAAKPAADARHGRPGLAHGGMKFDAASAVQESARMLGVDLESRTAKLDTLPFSADRSLLLNVPVGGIDTLKPAFFGPASGTYKVEQLFKCTDEQTQALAGLRTEFETERKKLEAELLVQQKQTAEKARALRLKFEQRANDVLTGPDRETKLKLDGVARETYAKIAPLFNEAETLAKAETQDVQKLWPLIRDAREKYEKIRKEAQEKILAALPPEGRKTVEEALNQPRAQPWGGHRPGQGAGAAPGTPKNAPPATPPRPPSGDNF